MTKKILNKKQKIVISIVAALLIIALGVTAYVVISKKTRTTVALADVTAGDITETLKLSGTVNSENQASFEILDGTYVKSVNVRVGDAVKKAMCSRHLIRAPSAILYRRKGRTITPPCRSTENMLQMRTPLWLSSNRSQSR